MEGLGGRGLEPPDILFIKYSFFVGTRNFETEIQNYKYIKLCESMGK